MKNLIVISYIAVLFVCVFSVFAETGDNLRLERLFSEAMKTDGLEYGRIRKEIISDEDAELFLIEKGKSTNVYERVISRAMITWLNNTATNDYRIQAMKGVVGNLARAINFPHNLCGSVSIKGGGLFDMHEPSSEMIMLLETALKGNSYESEERRMEIRRLAEDQLKRLADRKGKKWNEFDTKRYWENLTKTQYEWDGYLKCLAASLSGDYEDPDVPIMLEILMLESDSDRMRECAFVGMSKTSSTNLIRVLLDGLLDRDENIRHDANRALKCLTGQDLLGDRENYQTLIQTNCIAEALPNLTAYIDAARRELESERIMFEKSSVRYTITRDEVVVTVSPPGYVTSATYIVPIDRETRKAKGHRWK